MSTIELTRASRVSTDMSRPRQVWVLAVLCAAVGVVVASVTSLYPASADVARATGASETQITWIIDAYTVAMAGLLLPAGALGDRYGRRGVMTIGLAVFVAGAVALQFVDTPGSLIVARVVLGVGAALILPSTLSIITSTFPAEFRDTAVAIWTAAFTLFAVIGGTLAAILLQFFSWRSAFWSVLVVGALVLVVSPTLPTSRDGDSPQIDVAGAVLSVVAIASTTYGLIEAGLDGWGSARIVVAFTVAVLATTAFVVVELRVRAPLLDVRLFTERHFGLAAFTVTMLFGAVYGIAFLTFPLEQLVFGHSALVASLPMDAMGLTVVPLTLVAGRLTRRLGLGIVAALGLALTAGGFVFLLSFGPASPRWLVFATTLVVGMGLGISMAPCTSAILEHVPGEKQGVAASVNHTVRELGTALGVALFGGLISTFYTSHVASATAHLPAAARSVSDHSLPGALQVAQRIGTAGPALVRAAGRSFMTAIDRTALVMLIVSAVSAALCLVWRPRRSAATEAVST